MASAQTKVKVPCSKEMDLERLSDAVRTILLAVGEDPGREGLLDTPKRVAKMYCELFGGLHEDPAQVLGEAVFTVKYDEMVVLRDIPFHSMCEHHLLPFTGKAHVAYLPNDKVVGVSKLARVVEVFARRPQIQEQLTTQVADLLMDKLNPKGVAVVLEATHTCMTIRGVKKPGSLMVTSALRGLFKSDPATRAEVMNLLHNHVSS
ncbi:MAG: GTP cyclohydrolase 1 [Phycisphaerae bacterium]|nr:GTP cyclohydrolase 1 [Phycisphaerae bacterium]